MATIVLIPLLFGIITFGIGFAQQMTLASAVRDGARFGSVNLYVVENEGERTCSDVVAATRGNARTLGMSGSEVEVTVKRGSSTVCKTSGATVIGSADLPPCQGASDTDNLSVTAQFAGRITIPLVMSKALPLKSSGVYRCEYH